MYACTNKLYLRRSTLFNVPINAAVSQAALPFLSVYNKRRTRRKSCDTCHDIPIWLINEVSSHSNIGHC